MEAEDLPLDMISNLPPKIIQTILTLMPMRDAFKTCILSRKWRYHCVNIPKLMFTDELYFQTRHDYVSSKCKLLHIVYPILLQHHGPISEFSLSIPQLESCCEIDQIIFHLSRNATVTKFTLDISIGVDHKLLSSFFNLEKLTHLDLFKCVFQPPSTFYGFSKLTSLCFRYVSITLNVLLRFISNCPLLKIFDMIEDEEHLMGSWDSGFVELFKCLPSIEHLLMCNHTIKCFAKGVIPQKLPTALVHFKVLHLWELSFANENELLSAILLVTNSPNIEKIKLEMSYSMESVSQTVKNLLDLQDYSHVILNHLHKVEIINFTNMKPLMDFMKLILAKSPVLKKVKIRIRRKLDICVQVKMLKDLLQYPRASTQAEIIFR